MEKRLPMVNLNRKNSAIRKPGLADVPGVMRRILLIAIIIVVCIPLSGCIHSDPIQALTQDMSGISVALAMDPYPPTQMETANLRLTLQDPNNQPISGAKVQLDLSKLDISMPPYFLQAKDEGNGIYQVLGTFPMSGNWQILVDVFFEGKHRQFNYLLEVD
jgi:YtkA-like